MPQKKSKEDTWNEAELKKSLKEAGDKRRSKDKDKGSRESAKKDLIRNEEKKTRKSDSGDKERHRDKEASRKPKNETEEEREKRHKEERRRRKDEEERHHRSRDGEEDRKHHRSRDDDDERRRRHRDKDSERDQRHRDKDRDRDERKHRRDKDDRRSKDDDFVKTRDGDKRRVKSKDEEEQRKHNKGSSRDKEKDREKKERDSKRDRDGKDRKDRGERHDNRERRKDREKEKSSSSSKSKIEETKEVKKIEAVQETEENGYNDYEDDFEDYEDDFESEADDDGDDEGKNDDDETGDTEESERSGDVIKTIRKSYDWDEANPEHKEMAEMLYAMQEENERLLVPSKSDPSVSCTRESRDSRQKSRDKSSAGASGRTFINFVSAKQREMSQQAASKTQRRYKELSKLIDLDIASYEIFELPPVKEYEMYIMNFGRSNTQQVYVQTNEDNIERDIQTEVIETKEKWSQHPSEEFIACGGEGCDENSGQSKGRNEKDTSRLGDFINMAGQTMAILLEEQLAEKKLADIKGSNQSSVSFSESFLNLVIPDFLKSRPVIYSVFSPVQTYLILTVHSRSDQASNADIVCHSGVICVWNINEPSRPQKVLLCNAEPVCCCFSPNKANLVFAGMRDGCVVVWDLRESASNHRRMNSNDEEWVLRYPTYSTAGVLNDENHHSPVTAVMPMVSTAESVKTSLFDPRKATSDVSSGLSFQLVSLEEAGFLHIWVVAEISNPDEAGSESDFGLSPGGRIKLLKSSTIKLNNPLRDNEAAIRMFNLQLLPSDVNHFYVGTDVGHVIHGVRHTGRAPPKSYHTEEESPVSICSLDFSPFAEHIFLAGCDDGSIRLHNINSELPIMCWPSSTNGNAVSCICWSRSRPSVFFVVDDDGRVHVWNLLMDDSSPIKIEKVNEQGILSFCLSNDHCATGLGLPGRQPQMVICTADNKLEVHNVSQQYAVAALDEVYQFTNYVDSL